MKRNTVAGPLYTDRHGLTRRADECRQPRASHGWQWPPEHLRCPGSGQPAADGVCPTCGASYDTPAGLMPAHVQATERDR